MANFLLDSSVSADEIFLQSGDRLTGTILQHDEQLVVMEHAVLGQVQIPASEVASMMIDPPADQSVPVDVIDNVEEAAAVPEKEWNSKFDLSLGASAGNTDSQNFRIGTTSLRETDQTRTALDATYYYGSDNGDRNENRFTTGILHDWLLPDSRWIYFAQGRYDYDEFKSWEHRLGMHGGVGYELIKRDDFNLTLRAGTGATKEFGSEAEELRPEILFGGDLEWTISDRQSLTAGTTIYPDLGKSGEYRSVSHMSWSLKVDDKSNTSIHAGLEHEYQSDVDLGVDNNDLRIFAGLSFDY